MHPVLMAINIATMIIMAVVIVLLRKWYKH